MVRQRTTLGPVPRAWTKAPRSRMTTTAPSPRLADQARTGRAPVLLVVPDGERLWGTAAGALATAPAREPPLLGARMNAHSGGAEFPPRASPPLSWAHSPARVSRQLLRISFEAPPPFPSSEERRFARRAREWRDRKQREAPKGRQFERDREASSQHSLSRRMRRLSLRACDRSKALPSAPPRSRSSRFGAATLLSRAFRRSRRWSAP